MAEWHKFRVGEPSRQQNWTNPACVSLSHVSHVSHIKSALNIVETGMIRADLVFDESKLNTRRIRVVWVSPNHWYDGYRYGNVDFQLDFAKLIQDKRYYWVESVAYGVPACRILISARIQRDLDEYDPKIGDGPWWYDQANDAHYYNDKFCLEFMIEDDVAVNLAATIHFVDHHPKWCSLHRMNPDRCRDIGTNSEEAGALFVAGLVAEGVGKSVSLFGDSDGGVRLPISLRSALTSLYFRVADNNMVVCNGNVVSESRIAGALSRAVCNCFLRRDQQELEQLRGLFKSRRDLKDSLAKVMADHFGIEDTKTVFDW